MFTHKHFYLFLAMLALASRAAPSANIPNATTNATNIDETIFDGQFSFPAVYVGNGTFEDWPPVPGADIVSSSSAAPVVTSTIAAPPATTDTPPVTDPTPVLPPPSPPSTPIPITAERPIPVPPQTPTPTMTHPVREHRWLPPKFVLRVIHQAIPIKQFPHGGERHQAVLEMIVETQRSTRLLTTARDATFHQRPQQSVLICVEPQSGWKATRKTNTGTNATKNATNIDDTVFNGQSPPYSLEIQHGKTSLGTIAANPATTTPLVADPTPVPTAPPPPPSTTTPTTATRPV
ncbi:hypothetical protein B0H19DRAFT_1071401 [Mycena capillaripes]|nr:hypothetical protein B0H19DRAFT_1071401 [Mycena capillaripes]